MNEIHQDHTNPDWRLLFDAFAEVDYDSVLSFEDINKKLISGDIRTDRKSAFNKFRRNMLRMQGKYLESVRNFGYRIIKPNEHLRVGTGYIHKASKAAGRSVEVVINVPYDRLSDKEKSQHNLFAARVQSLAASLKGEITAVKHIKKHYEIPFTPRR